MLKRAEYDNIRSDHREYDLPRNPLVLGKNGAGKSGLREAICFALTGQDSVGSRNPRHLAQDPNLELSAAVQTVKDALIVRKLTPEGTQKLTLGTAAGARSLTQKEFEGMLMASADLMLAAMVPGYFLSQTHVRQAAILAELAPPMKRSELLEEILGGPIDQRFVALVDSDRSNMAVEADITAKRRELDKQLIAIGTMIEGRENEIARLKDQWTSPVEKPSRAKLIQLEDIKREQSLRNQEQHAHSEWRSKVDTAKKNLKGVAQLLGELREKMVEAGDMESSAAERAILDKLKESARQLPQLIPPQTPAIFDIVETDHCPTCGQTVGLKHKESVREKNRQILADFQAAMDRHNELLKANEQKLDAIKKDIAASEALVKQAEANEAMVRRWKVEMERYEFDIAQQDKVLAVPEPKIRAALTEQFDEDTYKAELRMYEDALKFSAVRDQELKRLEESKVMIEAEKKKYSEAEFDQKIYAQIETAMKGISALKLEKLKNLLALPAPYELTVGEKSIEVHDQRGTPYKLLSTGERMKVDCNLCLKINSLMKRPINILLVDDVELMDDRVWLKTLPVQAFQFAVLVGHELEVTEAL